MIPPLGGWSERRTTFNHGPIVDVFSLLLTNAILASVLAVVVAIACALIRRPAFASRAWLLVLVKLLVPPVVGVPIVWMTVANVDDAETETVDSAPVYGSRSSETSEAIDASRAPAPLDLALGPPPFAELPAPVISDAIQLLPHKSPEPQPIEPMRWHISERTIRASAATTWLMGVFAYWSLAFIRLMRIRRLLASARPASNHDLALVDDLARRMGLSRPPSVAFIAADISPMVWTASSVPRVLLPQALWQRLGDSQKRAILAHELSHICRGDVWVRWLELLVLGIYWWFPVAWLARRQLRFAEESCCDAWVLWALPDQAPAYAEALVETAAFVSSARFVPLASGGAARLSSLKRRIGMILQHKPAHRLRWPLALALAALALALLPWRPMLVEAQQPPPASGGKTDPIAKAQNPASTAPAAKMNRTSDPTTASTGQPPRTGTPMSGNWPSYPTSGATLEAIEEEVALLEAQLATRRAVYRGAEVELKAQTVHFDEVKRGVEKGVVSRSELVQAETAVEKARANLDVKAAELKEHEVKLTFAMRRLQRVQPTPPPKTDPGPRSGNRRPNTGTTPSEPGTTRPATGQYNDALTAQLKDLEKQATQIQALSQQLTNDLMVVQKRLQDLESQSKQIEAERRRLYDLWQQMDQKIKPDERKPR